MTLCRGRRGPVDYVCCQTVSSVLVQTGTPCAGVPVVTGTPCAGVPVVTASDSVT